MNFKIVQENKRLLFFEKKRIFIPFDIESLSLEEKDLNYNTVKDIGNLATLEKGSKAIKDRILRDLKNLFGHEEEENHYKLLRLRNFWSNNYIEYKSNDGRNKTLSLEEYLNKISPY